ncbi:hypothetical protein [Flagellimonas amoyensis]|uniref:hypothetical protein n=1 Tax=Flagellimonas amoyensis TaxID=2169401 RepID=UPI00131F1851|nr:hypothetical protein [Allomuricauda amoyensis]
MEIVIYLFVAVFILLLIGLAYILVKDFKEIVLGLVNMCKPDLFHPISWFLSPIWLIGYALEKGFGWDIIDKYGNSDGLEKYSFTEKLQLDFSMGEKYIVSKTSNKKAKFMIEDFLGFCDGKLRLENFQIKNTEPIIIQCPHQITFYDFSILTQHFCNDIKDSWGVFKSGRMNYYSYSDKNTGHNIIGRTGNGQKFSIYTLDDLYQDQTLKLNAELKVKNFDRDLVNNGPILKFK